MSFRYIGESYFQNVPLEESVILECSSPMGVTRLDIDYSAEMLAENIAINSYKDKTEIQEIIRTNLVTLQEGIFDQIRLGTAKSIRGNQYYTGPRSFDFIEAAPVNKRVMEKVLVLQDRLSITDDPVAIVNLDPLLNKIIDSDCSLGYNFQISRKHYLHKSKPETGGVVARPGSLSIEEQIAAIPKSIRRIILTDDNIETGGSLTRTIEIFEAAGFEVVGAVVGIDLGSNNTLQTKSGIIPIEAAVKYQNVDGKHKKTVIEESNMIIGMRGPTKIHRIIYSNGQMEDHTIRIPELDPVSNVADLSEMEDVIRYEISAEILRMTSDFYKTLREKFGFSIKLGDAFPGSTQYFSSMGYGNNTSLAKVAADQRAKLI